MALQVRPCAVCLCMQMGWPEQPCVCVPMLLWVLCTYMLAFVCAGLVTHNCPPKCSCACVTDVMMPDDACACMTDVMTTDLKMPDDANIRRYVRAYTCRSGDPLMPPPTPRMHAHTLLHQIHKSQQGTGDNHAVSAMKFGILKQFLDLGW